MGSNPTCPASVRGAVMRVGGLEAPLHLLQQLPDFVIQPLREFGGHLWRENPPNVKATPAGGWASLPRAQPAGAQPEHRVCNLTGVKTRPGQIPTAASPPPRSPARPRRSSRWLRTCHSPRRDSAEPAAPSWSRSARPRPAPAPPRKAPLPPLGPSRPRGLQPALSGPDNLCGCC